MIRINLVPRDEARRQVARQRDRQVATLVLLSLVVIVILAEVFTRRALGLAEQNAALHRSELAVLNQKYQSKVLLERKEEELRSKLRTIELLEEQRQGPVRVLAALGAAPPHKLWLTEVRETGGSALISGRGLDNQTVALFMRNLESSPYFARVELVETKQVEEGKAKLKEFSIRSQVVYAGGSDEPDASKNNPPAVGESSS